MGWVGLEKEKKKRRRELARRQDRVDYPSRHIARHRLNHLLAIHSSSLMSDRLGIIVI